MSASNARIVHEVLAAWQERRPERVVGLIAPEAEIRPLRAQLESTGYVGEAGMLRMWADLDSDWAQLEFDPDETHHDGDDVVVLGRVAGRSHGAGAEIDTRMGWRWIVQGGLIAHARSYSEPGDALRAAGLAETTGRDVALVRRHYEAFNRDDLDGVAGTLHAEVEIVGSDERGGGRLELHKGREQATAFFAEIKSLVTDNEVSVLSLDARPGRVEASVRLRGTLRESERSGSLPAIHFFAIRDGLIARIETYRPDWRGAG
jgi:ketosteroid isomerase-like protein